MSDASSNQGFSKKEAGSAGKSPSPGDPAYGAEPSGYKGDNPSTAGPGPTKVGSNTPENENEHLNPSAPEDSNTTPGTTGDK